MIFRRITILCILLLSCSILRAGDFQIDRQKLKLSLEYENFVDDNGNEVSTPGVKATYLLKVHSDIKKKLYWNLDLQSGVKTNLETDFDAGQLWRAAWSNRVLLQGNVPVGRFYFGGAFYFRNQYLGDQSRIDQFVDIFGGLGFRDIAGTAQGGVALSRNWDLSMTASVDSQVFQNFPLSDSTSHGGSAQLTRKFDRFKLSAFFRARNVDYQRPVFPSTGFVVPFAFNSTNLQKDRFREGGIGVEFSHPFYFAGAYSYQINNSNNPGFSYRNHQVSLLVGTEIGDRWHIQAYGILQRYDFLEQDGFLPFPVLLGENDDANMAASIVRTLTDTSEIELGVQRLTHKSSFVELNANKAILYAAYNYRF